MSTRYNSNSIRIYSVDQIVTKPLKNLPPHSYSNSLRSIGLRRNLIECMFHLLEKVRTKARHTHFVVLRRFCDFGVSIWMEYNLFLEMTSLARWSTSLVDISVPCPRSISSSRVKRNTGINLWIRTILSFFKGWPSSLLSLWTEKLYPVSIFC